MIEKDNQKHQFSLIFGTRQCRANNFEMLRFTHRTLYHGRNTHCIPGIFFPEMVSKFLKRNKSLIAAENYCFLTSACSLVVISVPSYTKVTS
jgi:hypothetical protein